MTDRDPSLLRELTKRLARWRGFRVGYAVRDSHGPYARWASHPTGRYLFACKKELFAGRISFMTTLADRAADADATLVCAVGEEPTLSTCYAIDPDTLRAVGEPASVVSKQGVRVDVLQADVSEHCVRLGDVLAGVAEPPVVEPTGQQQLGRARLVTTEKSVK